MNKVVLILIAIVLVGIAGFATLWLGVGSRVQEAAEAILVEWRDGRLSEIYRGATPEFRQGRSPEQFKAYLDYWRTRRGAFEAVEKRTGVSFSSGTGDKDTKAVTLTLRFQRGEAEGRFVFRPQGNDLRLLHMSIREPAEAVEKNDAAVLEAMAHSLFMLYNEKNYVGLYAALSPELQMAWPPAQLEPQLEALHAKGGRIDEQFTQRSSKDEDDGDRRTILYDLQFESTPGTAKLAFQWKKDHWVVTTLLLSLGS